MLRCFAVGKCHKFPAMIHLLTMTQVHMSPPILDRFRRERLKHLGRVAGGNFMQRRRCGDADNSCFAREIMTRNLFALLKLSDKGQT